MYRLCQQRSVTVTRMQNPELVMPRACMHAWQVGLPAERTIILLDPFWHVRALCSVEGLFSGLSLHLR